MAAAGDYNRPPPFDKKTSYKSWKKEIEVWRRITNLDKRKQALAVIWSLTGRARKSALEIPADDLEDDSGMDLLITTLDSVFLKEETDQHDTEFDCESDVSIGEREEETSPPAVDVEQNPAADWKEAKSKTKLVSDATANHESDDEIRVMTYALSKLKMTDSREAGGNGGGAEEEAGADGGGGGGGAEAEEEAGNSQAQNANDEHTVRIVGIHKVLKGKVYLHVEVPQVKLLDVTPARLAKAFGIKKEDLEERLRKDIPLKAVVEIKEGTITSINPETMIANDKQTVRIVGIHKVLKNKVHLHVEVQQVKLLDVTPARLAKAVGVKREDLEKSLLKKIPGKAVVKIKENTIMNIKM